MTGRCARVVSAWPGHRKKEGVSCWDLQEGAQGSENYRVAKHPPGSGGTKQEVVRYLPGPEAPGPEPPKPEFRTVVCTTR